MNFKKRTTCVSCGARKPDGASRPLDDWRDGEKFPQGPWECECKTKNEAGAFFCINCKRPSADMQRMEEEYKAKRAADEGRGGGLFDRQDPNDKKQWDSDGEEFDDFGRRKRKKDSAPAAPGGGVASARGGAASSGAVGGPGAAVKKASVSEKQKAALERLRNKHSVADGLGGGERASSGSIGAAGRDGGGVRASHRRSRTRSRSRGRRR